MLFREKFMFFLYIWMIYDSYNIFNGREREKKIGRERLGKIVVFWGDERLIDR